MINLNLDIDQKPLFMQPRWLFVTMLVFFLSCRQGDTIHHEAMIGKWEIRKAERNGKETGYLRRGYFIFEPGGKMTVNITGEDEQGTYKMNNNKLLMGDKNFELLKLSGDTMVIKYLASPTSQFRFYMQKAKADAQ